MASRRAYSVRVFAIIIARSQACRRDEELPQQVVPELGLRAGSAPPCLFRDLLPARLAFHARQRYALYKVALRGEEDGDDGQCHQRRGGHEHAEFAAVLGAEIEKAEG
jgi:hypothetical protein